MITCPTCGSTLSRLQDTGRLGCPDCYQTFSGHLESLFKRIQVTTHHGGKRPIVDQNRPPAPVSLDVLRRRLKSAIEGEAFEEAALIRDQISEAEAADTAERPVK